MPSQQIQDMTDSTRHALPKHAQAIVRAAFNSASNKCADEARAFRVAGAAIKRADAKSEQGNWQHKPD